MADTKKQTAQLAALCLATPFYRSAIFGRSRCFWPNFCLGAERPQELFLAQLVYQIPLGVTQGCLCRAFAYATKEDGSCLREIRWRAPFTTCW
jgi:hypothetical protein